MIILQMEFYEDFYSDIIFSFPKSLMSNKLK